MTLTNPDSNGVARYAESTPIGERFSDFMNLGLAALSRVLGRDLQFASAAAMNAHTGMRLGDKALRTDTGIVMRYSGLAWKEWESGWLTIANPLFGAGFTLGAGGSASVQYRYVNGDIEVKFRFVFGASPTITSLTFEVPALETPQNNEEYGPVWLLDAGTTTARGHVRAFGSASAVVQIVTQTTGTGPGAPTGSASITATAPWTWAAGDVISGRFIRGAAA